MRIAVLCVVLLCVVTCARGFVVSGYSEEWEFDNYTIIEEARPGFRVRVTQKGFDTAARLGLDLAMAFIDHVEIPPVQEAIGNADVTITNVRINRLARPRAEIRPIPGKGMFARVWRVQPKVTADYHAVVSWGYFGTSEYTGKLTVRGQKLDFKFELLVLRNPEEEGPQMLIDTRCAFTGDLNVVFEGGSEDILNLGSALFASNIMSLAASQACHQAKVAIMENMATDISSLPVNETKDLEWDFNYGLVRFPEFNSEFVELWQRGTVYYIPNRVEPPFQPEVIPAYLNHTDKMIYLYMSDYAINSAFYAVYLSGLMDYNVTRDIMPPEVQDVFRTRCGRRENCLGTVFPALGSLYPDAVAGMTIYATDNPEIHLFNGTTAQISAQGEAQFFVDDEHTGDRDILFKISFYLFGDVTVGVNGSNVNFLINDIYPKIDIVSSNIGDVSRGGNFQNVISLIMQRFVMPQLTELAATGFELPKSSEVEFVDPEVIPLDVDGTFVVATDFRLSLPEELLAKGLETFRRHKGPCKHNCTSSTAQPEDEYDEYYDSDDDDDGDDDAEDYWEDYYNDWEDEEEEPTTTTTTQAPRRRKGQRRRSRNDGEDAESRDRGARHRGLLRDLV